ncbi:hypothetical protein TcasGA2_TC004487 [Tribolium castaneum]|uniref:Uncharacterized protein n=1 Tax=Tribolium castaneum TaxID=7070 RepID=D6WCG9_TRICA|nr:hypothetical protein TcasGA2_TC004487 [Tribolium castaneum]
MHFMARRTRRYSMSDPDSGESRNRLVLYNDRLDRKIGDSLLTSSGHGHRCVYVCESETSKSTRFRYNDALFVKITTSCSTSLVAASNLNYSLNLMLRREIRCTYIAHYYHSGFLSTEKKAKPAKAFLYLRKFAKSTSLSATLKIIQSVLVRLTNVSSKTVVTTYPYGLNETFHTRKLPV